MSRNRDPFNENPNTYLYDSINTRVPPMNISGKKSTPTLARMRMESPVNIHSHSFQNLPKAPMIVRRESPFMNRGESPIMIRRESPQPSFFYEPERERVFMPPPQPLIRSARPVVYRPALMNLTNRIPNPLINLNPFEVVEHLFLEENTKREPKNKEYSQTAKIEKTKKSNNKSEKGTDPMETFQDAKTQTEVEKAVIKNVAENIPSIPNEDKSDPNIKIASYVVSPIQKKSDNKNESFQARNESFKGKSEHESYSRNTYKKKLDEKKKFIKAMLEEIDEFLVRQKEIDKKREKELNSIKYYS